MKIFKFKADNFFPTSFNYDVNVAVPKRKKDKARFFFPLFSFFPEEKAFLPAL